MSNKILLGEKAIRQGRFKIWLCEVDNCTEPIHPRGKKYCIRHSNERRSGINPKTGKWWPSGKSKIDWSGLHGDNFYYAFDDVFGLLYLELKELSGAML